MIPRIETSTEKNLVGKRITTSLSENRTAELWRSFMIDRKEIKNSVGRNLYSLQVYPPDYFENFKLEAQFEKWALMEVTDSGEVPAMMEHFYLKGGLYAVFLHKGPASSSQATFQYIFRDWLPSSAYVLDSRPHFEVMGERYKHDAPDSEEEIWIPVKLKSTRQ